MKVTTVSEIKIEKNVPLPSAKAKGISNAMRSMRVGDSFVFPSNGRPGGIHTTAKNVGIKVTTRTTAEGIRVWRIS